ncbi:MAG: hypothetical protein ACLVJ6_01425 [Merdibacter sp.]
MTDPEGKTVNIPLYAPDIDLSLEEDNDVRPHETYNVEMRLSCYEAGDPERTRSSRKNPAICRCTRHRHGDRCSLGRSVSNIVDHHLLTNYGGNNQGQTPPIWAGS